MAIFAGAAGGGVWTVWSETSAIIMKLAKYTWEHISVNILSECCDILGWRPRRPPLITIIKVDAPVVIDKWTGEDEKNGDGHRHDDDDQKHVDAPETV